MGERTGGHCFILCIYHEVSTVLNYGSEWSIMLNCAGYGDGARVRARVARLLRIPLRLQASHLRSDLVGVTLGEISAI